MENKIKAAFDGVHMGDACAARIEEALRMPAAAKEYCAQPAQPAKPRWTRVAAAAAVLVVLCCILMPVAKQTKEAARQNWLDLCRTALAEVQGRDSVHITAVTAAEGFPGETGAENRYWQQGNMWLRIGEMNFENSNEDYVVGNLWTPIGKYRFGFAGDYDPVVRPNWSVAGEDRQWEPYWIMDFDLDTAAILSVEGSSDSQGSAVTISP